MRPSDPAPRVSVIIPAYNASQFIARAIGSAQQQTERDIEIIVIDDASTDDTVAAVRALAASDPRIRLLEAPHNGGPSAARNIGLDQARGRWIALLDADDAFRPERLATLCDLAEREQLDAIGDDIVYYDDLAGVEVGPGGFVAGRGLQRLTLDDYLATTTYQVGMAEALYRDETPVSLLKLVLRKGFLDAHPVRYSSRYRYCEDFIFYFDLLRDGATLGLLPQPLYVYTEQLGTISRQSSPHSRTVADRRSIVAAVDEILAAPDGLTARQRRLLALRRRSTEAAIRYDGFRRETASFGKGGILLRLLAKPTLALRFVRELRHGLQSRLRQRAFARRG